MINNNFLPYFRKDISTLFVLSAAIALLTISPLLVSNLLLQPVQAQTTMTFKRPSPAEGGVDSQDATITLDAKGTNSSGSQTMIGRYEVKNAQDGSIIYNGTIESGEFLNNSMGESISLIGSGVNGPSFHIISDCNTSDSNVIDILSLDLKYYYNFHGPVECSSSQVGGNNAYSMAGTTQSRDSDGDGIPDSIDNCPHNSHHRCFKEGDNSTTTSTTTDQPQQSSSNGTGNQTR